MQYIQFSRPTLWYQSLNDIIQPGYFIPAVKLRYSTQLIILKSYYSTPQQELRLGKSYSVHTSQTPLSLQASYSNLSLVLMRCSTWGRNSSVAVMKNWSDISLSLSLSVSHTYTHTHTHTHTRAHTYTQPVLTIMHKCAFLMRQMDAIHTKFVTNASQRCTRFELYASRPNNHCNASKLCSVHHSKSSIGKVCVKVL